MDTLFLKLKILSGNACMQVIMNGSYVQVKPPISKRDYSQLLTKIEQDIGAPDELTAD